MRILAAIGALGIIAGIGAAVFFFGGFYNVAGTMEDPAIIHWALTQVREASIDRHANDKPPAGLDDPAKVQAGAREFAQHGCANCHGAPGVNWAKFSEGLKPDPPDLKDVVGELTPSQLFWVIKNGINMTGMPSFKLAGAKDEDLWLIVAFLKKLPTVSEADYKAWTAPPAAAAPAPAPNPAAPKQ
jgi:mono/diheme cytochrome c family protein